MGDEARRLIARRQAKSKLKTLFLHSRTTNIIHYSCESFYDNPLGLSRRVTSIAVLHLESGQVRSFSIHLQAEKSRGRVSAENITEHYDELEKAMLDEFYELVERCPHFFWLHWNMRDSNYGFAALAHRYTYLRGRPIDVPDDHKVDLPVLLGDIYGRNFAQDPKMADMLLVNGRQYDDFLTGEEEASAFTEKRYVALHQSTLRKVRVFFWIAKGQVDGTLRTRATWWQRHGTTPLGVLDDWTDHWFFKVLGATGILISIVQLLSRAA